MYKNKEIMCLFSKTTLLTVATNENFYIDVFKVWASYYKLKYTFVPV